MCDTAVTQTEKQRIERVEEFAACLRASDPGFAAWAAGYGMIGHTPETQVRVHRLAAELKARGVTGDGAPFYDVLRAADRVTSAAMWLVVHETYAASVHLDGRELGPADFKADPQGHTGGALNMAPAYAGYMTINALTGTTRSWVMGQGHTVAAIDSVNLLLGNAEAAHRERYPLTDPGLTRYVRDFYSYRLNGQGEIDSPLGSHVNPHTAGGMAEGGYLGFTELQYVHMPLPGERLVVFLSDGAFEEQRGSDWAPRWWRAKDSGLVAPIMINNGRRIDQRTTMSQEGGIAWFRRHLRLNSFDPIVIDGRDPAAFAWLIYEIETRLEAAGRGAERDGGQYPVMLPYGIAAAKKGAGFYNAGTNLAHNLPLGENPRHDPLAARRFNECARKLWVPEAELAESAATLGHHRNSNRPPERAHPLARREPHLPRLPHLPFKAVEARGLDHAQPASPMSAVDELFAAIVRANPDLRPRAGNPDEMRSNRMIRTLEELRFRVTGPEQGVPEAIGGAVITALNEEAVVNAALANKAGINIVVSYEAFAVKMLGAVRQEITWAGEQKRLGRPPGWLSVPLVVTSHVYENGKNELSHQDPTMAEALIGERSDVSRVVFPADYNSALAAMRTLFHTRGCIWTMVTPKGETPALLDADEAEALVRDGAILLQWAGLRPEEGRLILTAIGAYQLAEALKASRRLAERGVAHRVIAMFEPGRFRSPRNQDEGGHLAAAGAVSALYPAAAEARVFLVHTRPEPMLGVLRPLDTGPRLTAALGFVNQGGTLDVNGMLFVNRLTWAHALEAAARVLEIGRERLLTAGEIAALDHRRSPEGVLFAPPREDHE